MYVIELYETQGGKSPVKEYLEKLAKESKKREIAQIQLYVGRLEDHGMAVNNTYPETIRKIQDDIYELRPGKHRVFFFYFTGNKIILLHAYRKHGQKAPKTEITKAINEMRDHKRRNQNE